MNKADLIEALAPKVGGRTAATVAVESLVDVILRQVASGGSVVVTGFGTFEKVDRAARTGRNPRTGEAVPIEATSSPRFRPAAYFKDVVQDPGRLPRNGLAGVRVGSDGASLPPEGAPPSVRRADSSRSARAQRSATTSSAGRRATSGAPSTVRATPPLAEPAPAPAAATPTTGGGLVAGGEEITMGMINAKKAQLARVKTDEVSKKSKGKKAGADKPAKDRKGKKDRSGKDKKGKKN